ncbi:MAG: hypothetical protein L3J65_00995 [Robiginitomaculum sp.]|nr:hypothetical protein [Robiginitomaculum sp.]
MDRSINIVDHLVRTFFTNNVGSFVEWINRPQQTVSYWRVNNSIPNSVERLILAKSDQDGLGISPADFFPERLPKYQTAECTVEAEQ